MRKGGAGRVTQEKSAHLFTQKRKQAPSDVLFPLGGWKKLSCPIQPPTNEMPSNSRGPDQKNLPFLQANHHCLVAADKDTLAPILPSLRQERREGEKGKCAQEHLTQTCRMHARACVDRYRCSAYRAINKTSSVCFASSYHDLPLLPIRPSDWSGRADKQR